MQVNSTQDWLTQKKRQIIAKTYNSTPPPQSRKYNSVFLSAVANNATRHERFIIPTLAAGMAGPIGGATVTSMCCLSNSATGALGAFQKVTPENTGTRVNYIPAMGVKSVAPTS